MGATASGERTTGAVAPGSRPPLAVPRRLLRLRSDAALAERFALGDEAAFDILYERYRPAVLSVCMGILGAAHDAEDVTQETFSALALALNGNPPQELRPWLARVARNRAIDVTRRGRQRALTRDGELPEVAAQQPSDKAELAVVLEGIRELPESQRTALLMRELGGHSYSEIAALLETHEDAVRGLIARARVGLRSYREAAQLPCAAARASIEAEPDGRRHSRAIRRHLRNCSSCRAYRAALRDDARALRAILPLDGGITGGGILGGGLAVGKSALVGAGLTQASAACAASVCAAGAVGGIVLIAPLHSAIAPMPIISGTVHRQVHHLQPVAKPVAVPHAATPMNITATRSASAGTTIVPVTHVHIRIPAAHARSADRIGQGASNRIVEAHRHHRWGSGQANGPSAVRTPRHGVPTRAHGLPTQHGVTMDHNIPIAHHGVTMDHNIPIAHHGVRIGSGTTRHDPASTPSDNAPQTPEPTPQQTSAQAPAQPTGSTSNVGSRDHTGWTGSNSVDHHAHEPGTAGSSVATTGPSAAAGNVYPAGNPGYHRTSQPTSDQTRTGERGRSQWQASTTAGGGSGTSRWRGASDRSPSTGTSHSNAGWASRAGSQTGVDYHQSRTGTGQQTHTGSRTGAGYQTRSWSQTNTTPPPATASQTYTGSQTAGGAQPGTSSAQPTSGMQSGTPQTTTTSSQSGGTTPPGGW